MEQKKLLETLMMEILRDTKCPIHQYRDWQLIHICQKIQLSNFTNAKDEAFQKKFAQQFIAYLDSLNELDEIIEQSKVKNTKPKTSQDITSSRQQKIDPQKIHKEQIIKNGKSSKEKIEIKKKNSLNVPALQINDCLSFQNEFMQLCTTDLKSQITTAPKSNNGASTNGYPFQKLDLQKLKAPSHKVIKSTLKPQDQKKQNLEKKHSHHQLEPILKKKVESNDQRINYINDSSLNKIQSIQNKLQITRSEVREKEYQIEQEKKRKEDVIKQFKESILDKKQSKAIVDTSEEDQEIVIRISDSESEQDKNKTKQTNCLTTTTDIDIDKKRKCIKPSIDKPREQNSIIIQKENEQKSQLGSDKKEKNINLEKKDKADNLQPNFSQLGFEQIELNSERSKNIEQEIKKQKQVLENLYNIIQQPYQEQKEIAFQFQKEQIKYNSQSSQELQIIDQAINPPLNESKQSLEPKIIKQVATQPILSPPPLFNPQVQLTPPQIPIPPPQVIAPPTQILVPPLPPPPQIVMPPPQIVIPPPQIVVSPPQIIAPPPPPQQLPTKNPSPPIIPTVTQPQQQKSLQLIVLKNLGNNQIQVTNKPVPKQNTLSTEQFQETVASNQPKLCENLKQQEIIADPPIKTKKKVDKEKAKTTTVVQNQSSKNEAPQCYYCKQMELMIKLIDIEEGTKICSGCLLEKMNPFSRVIHRVGFMEYKYAGKQASRTSIDFILAPDQFQNHTLQLEIRCVMLNKYGLSDFTFPNSCSLLINNVLFREVKPLLDKSCLKKRKDNSFLIHLSEIQKMYGVQKKYTFTCVEIIPELKMRQESMGQLYQFGLYLVQNSITSQIIENIKLTSMNQQIKLDACKNEIKIDKSKVSLICQFTFDQIQIPARGEFCQHQQCFDLNNFLEMMIKAEHRKWVCPLCKKICLTLVIDKQQQQILERIKQLEIKVDQVTLDQDGSLEKDEILYQILSDNSIQKYNDVVNKGYTQFQKNGNQQFEDDDDICLPKPQTCGKNETNAIVID